MNPIDYSGAFAEQTPSGSFMQGVKDGAGMQQLQLQQQQAERARAMQAQMNADLAQLSQNPTSAAIGKMSIKYPQLSENFKRSFDILEPAQKQAKLEHATQVYTALHNQQPDVAQKILKDQATALRNAGNETDAKAAETMAALIKEHPEFAKTSAGLLISAAVGGEKFAATFGALGGEERAEDLHGAAVSKAESEAVKSGAEAAVAQGTAGSQVQQAAENVTTAQHKRALDDLNLQISQADSETKRGQLVLERDKLIADQAFKMIDKGEAAQGQVDSAQHALDTIKELRSSPAAKDSVGNYVAGPGSVLGKLLSNIPGTENKDYRGQLESLKSQVFLPAVQQIKGMGALSNAEGEKLSAAVATLDADMSPKARDAAIGVIERFMTKGLQKGLANKAVPVQGGGFVANHPTFGKISEGDVNRLMKQFPGTTRDQIMEYLGKGGK